MRPQRFMIYSKLVEDNSAFIDEIERKLFRYGFQYDENDPELVLILGGDGSFLHAVHDPSLKKDGVSYLLFNTGHLGFFSDYQKEELSLFLEDIVSKEGVVESLPLYRFTIDGEEHHCVNDIALQSGETFFMNVSVNGELLTESRCNGIVVGTPTGSSGFLSSLGAPLIINHPNVYQFSILAACKNRLYTNPITKAILSGEDELEISIENSCNIEIYIDGGHRIGCCGKKFTFSHKEDKFVSLLHLRRLSRVGRLRKNISGKD